MSNIKTVHRKTVTATTEVSTATTPATGTSATVKIATYDTKLAYKEKTFTAANKSSVTTTLSAPTGYAFKNVYTYHTHIYRGTVINNISIKVL